jgi:hypothetical protein
MARLICTTATIITATITNATTTTIATTITATTAATIPPSPLYHRHHYERLILPRLLVLPAENWSPLRRCLPGGHVSLFEGRAERRQAGRDINGGKEGILNECWKEGILKEGRKEGRDRE